MNRESPLSKSPDSINGYGIPAFDATSLPLARITKLLTEILSYPEEEEGEFCTFLIPDPDLCVGKYAGETIEHHGRKMRCRSWRAWSTLAELLECRMLTPRPYNEGRLLLRFQKLRSEESFHRSEAKEKYEIDELFARIDKDEEPSFSFYYRRALQRIGIANRRRILDLGIHDGKELAPIAQLQGEAFADCEILGIDRCASALHAAKRRWPQTLQTFRLALDDLPGFRQERFDLILSIGTLQSPGIALKPLIMHLVQERLSPDGALLLGWPNSRWIDGELLYGARPRHLPFRELSLVVKDLFWIKKYLQQHRFRVVITGREYLFLEATRFRSAR